MQNSTRLGSSSFLTTLFVCGFLSASQLALGELVKFEIVEIESPTFEGKSFGSVGQYERIVAKAFLEVDPHDSRNAVIADLSLAPRNANGRVEFVADVELLKPIQLSRGNGRMLYDVVNRGRKRAFRTFNDAPIQSQKRPFSADGAGNGFLMRQGYTVVWSGWQGDVPPGEGLMRVDVPVLESVTGMNEDEFIFENDYDPFVATLSYPATDLDLTKATLTVRQNERDPRESPPDLTFEYFGVRSGGGNTTPSRNQIVIHRPDGFDAGAIYEFTYPAREPVVMGLGFAATRDVVSFLRRDTHDPLGNRNPLAQNGESTVHYAFGWGISQSGRFLRDLLYHGFNEDESGRMVFDGVMPHVAGSRKTFVNRRWAQPGRFSQQHNAHLTPGDQFPFTYGVTTDVLTGKRDGILARCQASQTCPHVMHTDSSAEFWQARASLVVTDTSGADIELPENVRAYFLVAPHSSSVDAVPRRRPMCEQLTNPAHTGATLRALLHALDRWVSEGIAPPGSHFPSRSAGMLVSPEPQTMEFPTIPSLTYNGRINELRVTDYSVWPPKEGASYPVFVPKVDADGNDLAGVRMPELAVPRATYLGWNHRREGYAPGELCYNTGSYIPFAETKAERMATGDSRRSIEERYPTRESYVEAVQGAVERLLEDGLLLEEDAARIREELARTPSN